MVQFFTSSFGCLKSQDHQTGCLSLPSHLTIPWCPVCILSSISSLRTYAITIVLPLMSITVSDRELCRNVEVVLQWDCREGHPNRVCWIASLHSTPSRGVSLSSVYTYLSVAGRFFMTKYKYAAHQWAVSHMCIPPRVCTSVLVISLALYMVWWRMQSPAGQGRGDRCNSVGSFLSNSCWGRGEESGSHCRVCRLGFTSSSICGGCRCEAARRGQR